MAKVLSAKEAAAEIGTTARELRKFIRSKSSGMDACGQGNRYEFSPAEVKELKKRFTNAKATATQPAPTDGKAAPKGKKGKKSKAPAKELTHNPEVDEIEDLEDLDEPETEDLEEIEVEDA